MQAEISPRHLGFQADDDPDAEPRRLLTYDAAARVLGGISKKSVERLVKQGHLTKVKVGFRVCVTIKSLDAYVEKLIEEAEADAA